MHDDEMGGSGESDVMGPRPSDLVASVRHSACLGKPLELSTTELDLHLMSIRDLI